MSSQSQRYHLKPQITSTPAIKHKFLEQHFLRLSTQWGSSGGDRLHIDFSSHSLQPRPPWLLQPKHLWHLNNVWEPFDKALEALLGIQLQEIWGCCKFLLTLLRYRTSQGIVTAWAWPQIHLANIVQMSVKYQTALTTSKLFSKTPLSPTHGLGAGGKHRQKRAILCIKIKKKKKEEPVWSWGKILSLQGNNWVTRRWQTGWNYPLLSSRGPREQLPIQCVVTSTW